MYVRSQHLINAPVVPSSCKHKRRRKSRLSMATMHASKMSPHGGKFVFEPSVKPRVKKHRSSSVDIRRRSFCEPEEAEYLQQGKLQMSNGNYAEALKLLKKAPAGADSLYNQSICYMHLNLHKSALPLLSKLSTQYPLYDRQLYVALSMCYVATKDVTSAIKEISKGLAKFPRFAEGYVIRGQLFNQQQRWDRAISDFRKVLRINPQDPAGILGLVESLEGMGDHKTVLQLLNKGIENSNTMEKCLLKRGKLYIRTKEFSKAIADLEEYTGLCKDDQEAFLLKGKAHLELSEYLAAGLCFEQVIRINPSSEFTPTCIGCLGAIKIKEKDFYGAIHTFKRISEDKYGPEIKVLKQYATGVIELIKRKFKNSISTFSKLIKAKSPIISEFLGQCYAFRAYGYTSIHEFKKAVSDYSKAKKMQSLDQASLYNWTVTNALIQAGKEQYTEAIRTLDKAHAIFPSNPDPLVFQVCILLSASDYSAKLPKSISLMDSAIALREEAEIFYYRALLKYLNAQFLQAIEDINKAVDKADDVLYEQYVIRGLCKAALCDYKDAIEDFTLALEIESRTMINRFRGICAYLTDDLNMAFSDFQKYVMARSEEYTAHLQAGNLLVASGSYEEAVKAFKCANEIEETEDGIQSLANCYITLGQFEDAKPELGKLSKLKTDLEILNIIEKENTELLAQYLKSPGVIFSEKYIRWFLGGFYLLSSKHTEALNEFQQVLELIHSKDSQHVSSEEALITEEENCEILYNIALCYLEINKSHSIYILKDLAQVLNSSHKAQVLFICGVINLQLGKHEKAQAQLYEGYKGDPDGIGPFQADEPVDVLPLNTGSDFSNRFPLIQIHSQPSVKVRPAISLPRVKVKPFSIYIETEVRDFMAIDRINPQPEAPWLNRVKGSIQFTENLIDVQSEFETEEEKPNAESDDDLIINRRPQSAVCMTRWND